MQIRNWLFSNRVIYRSIDQDELNEFASDPVADHVLLIDSYTDIEDFVNRLSTYTCTGNFNTGLLFSYKGCINSIVAYMLLPIRT